MYEELKKEILDFLVRKRNKNSITELSSGAMSNLKRGFIKEDKELKTDLWSRIDNLTKPIRYKNTMPEMLYIIQYNIVIKQLCAQSNCLIPCKFIDFENGYSKYCKKHASSSDEANIKRMKYWNNRTEEQKQEHIEKSTEKINSDLDAHIQSIKLGMANMDKESFSKSQKARFENMTEQEKISYAEVRSDWWKNLSDVERQERITSQITGHANMSPEKKELMTSRRLEVYYNKTQEQKDEINARRGDALKNTPPDERLIITEKIYKTKKINGSFNISEPEWIRFFGLCESYGFQNVIPQYRTDEYPFISDFYIKHLDLYIECHYYWTHGDEPFNKDNPYHQYQVHKWKNSNLEFNHNAIKNWTISDPRKLQTVIDNKLNMVFEYNTNKYIYQKGELIDVVVVTH